jgi:deoxyribonuclease-4
MIHRIGFHVSIEGGMSRAVGRALERRCTALQIFCGNPRGWKLDARSGEEIEAFRRARAEANLTPLFVHACYLINPSSPDQDVFERSVGRLSAELTLATAIGADYYVLHPGSQKEESVAWGISRAAEAITRALERAGTAPMVLLENTASARGPGGEFAWLGRLIERIEAGARAAQIGIAVDSCHAFGAGYDLRDAGQVDRLAADADKTTGLDRLRLLHVNDSRDAPGSRRDRHEHIGKGTIGTVGLGNFLRHPLLFGLPKILETPWVSAAVDRRNLRSVLGMMARP